MGHVFYSPSNNHTGTVSVRFFLCACVVLDVSIRMSHVNKNLPQNTMITLSLRSLTGVLAGVSVVLAKHLLRYQHHFFVCVRVCVRLVSQTTGHYFHTHSRRQTMAACGWLTRPAPPFVAFARCLRQNSARRAFVHGARSRVFRTCAPGNYHFTSF